MMRQTKILIVIISLLMQSCYSYKTISNEKKPIIVGKDYKIKFENKFVKAQLLALTDSIAMFKIGKQTKEVFISELQTVKEKKLSVMKTILLTLGISTTVAVVILVNLPMPNYYSNDSNIQWR